jgi:uncharacterized membrane protein YccF (DUF307 family)
MSVVYFVAGVIGMIFIVTIPFGVQAFKLAGFALWPFGRSVVRRQGSSDVLSLVGNVIWIVVGGWWLALIHIGIAVIFFITIIGIPFGLANVKFALLALTPFGLTVVDQTERTQHTVLVVDQLAASRPGVTGPS